MGEKIYPYAVSNIKAIENRMFDMQKYVQLAESKSPDDALKILLDAGLGKNPVESPRDFSNLLGEEMVKTFELVRELLADEDFSYIFKYKKDYQNFKVLAKQELGNINGEKFLVSGGTLDIEVVKKAFVDRNFKDFPPIMEKYIEKAFSDYAISKKGQDIDVALDHGVYASMIEGAKNYGSEYLIEFVEAMIDTTNMKSFLRILHMKKTVEDFKNVYIEGGYLDIIVFQNAFKEDTPDKAFRTTKYGDICENHMSEGTVSFEKACDNFMMDFAKTAKYMSLTLEPVVAYVYAKELESKTLSIIMTSKLNDIDVDIIKERLRDAYV